MITSNNITTNDQHDIKYIYKKSNDNNKKLCILSHGIFSNKTEHGRFNRLSKELNDFGYDTIAFDYRGHGDSSYTEFTINGAILDLKEVMIFAKKNEYTDVNIIASSFSASVIILYSSIYLKNKINKIILLNPVVDFKESILKSPQESKYFDNETIDYIYENGRCYLENGFLVSEKFFHELCYIEPHSCIKHIKESIRVLHGSHDKVIDHKLSIKYFSKYKNCIVKIVEAEHGFKEDEEKIATQAIHEWLE